MNPTRRQMMAKRAAAQWRASRLDMWPLQLGLNQDPLAIMGCCVLLNRADHVAVRLAMNKIRDGASREDAIKPLGLLEKRLRAIDAIDDLWYSPDWNSFADFRAARIGVGKYTEDAVRLFCFDDSTVEPEDRALRAYMEITRGKTASQND